MPHVDWSRVTAFASKSGNRLAILVLLVIPVALLGRGLLPGKVLSPADVLLTRYPWAAWAPGFKPSNALYTDVAFLFHPWLLYAASEIRHGRFPLWNPHAFAGAPFFANPQSALLFPLNALAYVLPVTMAIGLIAITKLATAGVTMYWFLRLLSVGRLAAVTGGAAFMFSSAVVLWLPWSLGSTLALMPLLFATTERLRQRGDRWSAAALAGSVALAVLAGYPQVLVQTGLLLAAWALWRARDAGGFRFLGHVALACSLGILAAAVQLLPFLEYARESAVYFLRSDGIAYRPLPLGSAMTFLMPYYYGTLSEGDFWGFMNFNENTMWVGVMPLLVVALAIRLAWDRPATRFWVGAGVASAAIVFGVPRVVGLIATVPPFSLTLMHRFSAVLIFSLCALCGLGLEAIRLAPARSRLVGVRTVRAAYVGITVVAMMAVVRDFPILEHQNVVPVSTQYVLALLLLTVGALGLLWMLSGSGRSALWGGLVVLGVEIVGVVPFVLDATPTIETRHFYPPAPPALRHVQERSTDRQRRVIVGSTVNLGMLYGLLDVAGYDGMTPRRIVQLASPDELVQQDGSGALTVSARFGSQVFDVLAVERMIVAPGAPAPAPHFVLEYDGIDARVYRNRHSLPRAFIARRARTCVPDGAVLAAFHDGTVDFHEEVLLAACDAPTIPGLDSSGTGSAVIVRAEPDLVVVRAHADSSSYLVLADTWFPGWRASMGGVEQPVWRADHALRAVWIPPGVHEVVFRYRPMSVRLGAALSGAGVCLVLGLLLPWRRRGSRS